MIFSKPAATPQAPSQNTNTDNAVTQEAWNEWNTYQFNQFKAKEKTLANGKRRKEKTLIGVPNLIMDLGTPPAKDSEWETKCALPQEGEEYSQEELEWKAKNKTHDFKWVKEYNSDKNASEWVRKQTSPSYPQQEFGIAVDFPQIQIDFSKHPHSTSTEPDMRPLRVSLNGSFHNDFYKTIVFDASYKPVSERNIVYQICTAAGREKQLVDSNFDIGVAAQAICNFSVVMDLSEKDGKINVYPKASKPSPVEDIEFNGMEATAEQQIESALKDANLSEFVGILLNKIDGYDYTPEMLNMLGRDTYGYVKRASTSKTFKLEGVSKKTGNEYSFEKGVDYQGSDFQKAWDARVGANTPQTPSNLQQEARGEEKPSSASKPIEKEVKPSESDSGSFEDDAWSDDIPFAPEYLPHGKMLLHMM